MRPVRDQIRSSLLEVTSSRGKGWKDLEHSSGVAAQMMRREFSKMTVSRSKTEERYAETRRREQHLKHELETATQVRLEKTAKLRQQRIAKEAEDAAAKQAAKDVKAASQSASKKSRSR
jgi:hypothetical protein